ncbi:MAG: TerC family protein [Paraperlucidibaca sp.]
MFEWIADPQAWITLATLSLLEIVLGIDNIIFLTILVNKVAPEKRQFARVFGLALAMLSRIALLLSITWVMRLTDPLITLAGIAVTGRDLILIGGGLFLLWKSATEIFDTVEGESIEVQAISTAAATSSNFMAIIVQIAIIDIVFSLDSVITAVGLAQDVSIMVIAIVLSVVVMMFAAKPIGEFVEEHPSIKVLALAFLILVGTLLIAEGFGQHVPKGYVYGAMAFSVMVEMLNIRMRKRRVPDIKA